MIEKEFEVGDVVIPRNNKVVLACGSGRYSHAIVSSLNPFMLVSDYGDMVWHNEQKEDYIALCQASKKILKKVANRMKYEYNNGFIVSPFFIIRK